MTSRFLGVKAGRIFAVGLAAAVTTLAGCAQDVDVLHGDKSASNGKGGQAPEAGGTNTNIGSKEPSVTGGYGDPSEMDLYVMLDQSSSLNDRVPGSTSIWWDVAVEGILGFLSAPSSSGVGIGLQYFPLGGIAPASCLADYTTPEVEIAPLPGNASPLAASLQAHKPADFTPTAPALRGAIIHMKAWAAAHPSRRPGVVFITDGFPTECDPQAISAVASIAAEGANNEPVVRTYVIGLNLGLGGRNLDELAQAGRTGHAVLIDQDVSPSVEGALTRIIENPDGG